MKYLVGLFVLVAPFSAIAHPGGLNSEGCHYCRTNCEEKYGIPTNDYHCHAGGDTSVYTPVPGAEAEEQPAQEEEPSSDPEPTPEPVSQPVSSSADAPDASLVRGDYSDTSSNQAVANPASEPNVAPPNENIEDDESIAVSGEPEDEPMVEEVTVQPLGDVADSDQPESTPGETVLGLAILGGLGYGAYKGVKKSKEKK